MNFVVINLSLIISSLLLSQKILGQRVCPCEDLSLCKTVNYTGNEVFAFVLNSNRSVWTQFDWTKLTTISMVDFYDPELLCHAHQHRVRVVSLAGYPVEDLLNEDKIENWISTQLKYVSDRFMDGINIDIEDAIARDSPLVNALSRFTERVKTAFNQYMPASQVTFDVPWSPYNVNGNGVDGRNYNFTALASSADFLFVMSYDERSQIFDDQCIAGANSGLYDTAGGILAYLKAGISSDKLVLGLPWYGYDYECVNTGQENACFIKRVPFRGVNCSDAAGRQLPYSAIAAIVDRIGSSWDEHTQTAFVNFVNASDKVSHQIWFDDEFSLSLKISFASFSSLRGVGTWTANSLDYSGSASGRAQIRDMWATFPNYKSL